MTTNTYFIGPETITFIINGCVIVSIGYKIVLLELFHFHKFSLEIFAFAAEYTCIADESVSYKGHSGEFS